MALRTLLALIATLASAAAAAAGADRFRNYYAERSRLSPPEQRVDRASLLNLTVPEMTVLRREAVAHHHELIALRPELVHGWAVEAQQQHAGLPLRSAAPASTPTSSARFDRRAARLARDLARRA